MRDMISLVAERTIEIEIEIEIEMEIGGRWPGRCALSYGEKSAQADGVSAGVIEAPFRLACWIETRLCKQVHALETRPLWNRN